MTRGKMKKDIHKEIKERLKSMEKFGQSRHKAKKEHDTQGGLYSYSTARNVNRWCQRLGDYIKKNGEQGRHTPLEGSLDLAKDFFAKEIVGSGRYSPATQKMVRSSIAKLYGVSGDVIGETKKRRRANIMRGRSDAMTTRYGRFRVSSPDNKKIMVFGRGAGLRQCEMRQIRGTDLIIQGEKAYIKIGRGVAKGGKKRVIEVLPEYAGEIIQEMRNAGKEKVFAGIKVKNAPEHTFRAQYAMQLYNKYAVKNPKNTYVMRDEYSGTVLDRDAMQIVSRNLGHERVQVFADSYYYELAMVKKG